jgi:hypothetical protein
MGLRQVITRSGLLLTGYRRFRNLVSGVGWGAFHGDAVYRELVLELLRAFPVTAFVETGTSRGYSTELVAAQFPALPVFTSEVLEETYRIARSGLSRYRNITQMLGSSEKCLDELLKSDRVGGMPLYYLDAHWQKYWPLRDELRLLGARGGKAIIVIDDFEIPGQPQFEFDIDGGGEVIAGEACNLDYIRPALASAHTYHAVFPKYDRLDAFGAGSDPARDRLRGQVTLFQNLPSEYEAYLARPLVAKHCFGHGLVSPAG